MSSGELPAAGEQFQGEAQGFSQSAQSLGRVAGPLVFTAMYQTRGGTFCYVAAGLLTMVAWFFATVWVRRRLAES